MANAICPACLRLTTWRAQRGCKLADLHCPDCRGGLQKAKYHAAPAGGFYGDKDGREGHYGPATTTDCDPRREAERDARQCVEDAFPRFIGDSEDWSHIPEGELGTEYHEFLTDLARALPRQDDDPSIPF